MLGSYRVTRSGRAVGAARAASAYDTTLRSIEPLQMSCSCADFVRSSLGLCKHALVVLNALERSRALLRASQVSAPKSRRARLHWSPAAPLSGPADRLARLELVPGARALDLAGFTRARPAPGVLRDPERRLAFIDGLLRDLARNRFEHEPAVTVLLAEERARAALLVEGGKVSPPR